MPAWKPILKRIAERVAPRTTTVIQSARARAQSQRLVAEWGLVALNARLIGEVGRTVQSGPFAGTVLGPMSEKEHVGPFLLGTYEGELHAAFEELLGRSFSQIVDVGAKFGYYAVGLARHFPGVPVVAFDTDPWARRATREMARVNGTPNVEVRGFCDPAWFDRSLRAGALIVSDCEGYERELFTGARTPALRSATLLVEVHDQLAPGASDALTRRFAETHQIRVIPSVEGHAPPAGIRTSLTAEELRRAANEIRPPQTWLLISPLAS